MGIQAYKHTGLYEVSPGSQLHHNCDIYDLWHLQCLQTFWFCDGDSVILVRSLTSCGFLFLLSFPTWAIWMEHPYPLTHRVSESWTLYWVESGCAFNIYWKSGTRHSTRGYKTLSGSSIEQAAEELTAPFLCGFYISGWLFLQTHLLFRACLLHECWGHYGHQGHGALGAWDWWSCMLLNCLSHALDPLIWGPPSWIWNQIV